jgi:hypothetical protein
MQFIGCQLHMNYWDNGDLKDHAYRLFSNGVVGVVLVVFWWWRRDGWLQ